MYTSTTCQALITKQLLPDCARAQNTAVLSERNNMETQTRGRAWAQDRISRVLKQLCTPSLPQPIVILDKPEPQSQVRGVCFILALLLLLSGCCHCTCPGRSEPGSTAQLLQCPCSRASLEFVPSPAGCATHTGTVLCPGSRAKRELPPGEQQVLNVR